MAHMLLYFYDWIYYLHHGLPLLLYFTIWKSCSFELKVATFFAIAILELTTPPISLVWTLSKLKRKGWYYPYLSGFAYLNFVGIRMLYFPYIWYTYLPFTAQMIMIPFHGLNAYWFWKMTQYVLKS